MSIRARLFIGATAALGMSVLAYALWHWQSVDLARFSCYLLVAVLASSLKIQLPGLDGTMSVNFLFILLSVLELNLPETLLLGCTATLAQCLVGTRQKRVPIKIVFNVFSMMANAIVLSYFAYHDLQRVLGAGSLPLLVITALIFFVANTVPVAVIISLTEGKPAYKVWAECHFWSFPFYMVGATVVFAVGFLSKKVGWQTSLLVLPLVYWVYRSYHLYLAKLAASYPIVSIEDGMAENDWAGWKLLTDTAGKQTQLVGDDVFVTNTEFLSRGIKEGVANSILVKVNQIGTLTETLEACQMAHRAG